MDISALKPIKQALADFGTFGKNLADVFQKLPKFFGQFGKLNADSAAATKAVFTKTK